MAAAATFDVTRFIDEQKLGKFHVLLLIFTFLTVLVDGYDIGAVAFAAPALVKEWHLRRQDLGPLFSAGLFSGLFGPLAIGFLADRFGRKKAIIGSLIFFGLFTLISVTAQSLETLIVYRFIAGMGIAGILPIVTSLNNEYAPRRLRATMFVLMFCGVTLGGGLPGIVAGQYMGTYGWQILFWVGGLIPIVIAFGLAFVLPESAKYLALRPSRHRELAGILHQVNPRVSIPADAQFYLHGEEKQTRFDLKALFAGRLRYITPLFWAVNAINLMIFYFVNQWMPTILGDAGISTEHAGYAVTLFQFGGTIGGLLLMRPLDKYGFIIVPILFALGVPIVACIGLAGLPEAAVLTLVTLSGFCLLGLQFGNISSEGNVFPTSIRSFAVGTCFTAGRVGGVIGPIMAGYLLGAHVSLQQLFFIAAIPLFFGFIAGAFLTPLYRKEFAAQGIKTGATTGLAQGRMAQ